MMRLIISLLVACLLPGSAALAADGAVMKFAVYQQDTTAHKDVLLFVDSATVVKGVSAVGFLNNLSVDIEVTQIDSQKVAFTAHVVTLAPQPQTAAKQFQSEFGLPARISGLGGKNNTRYTLTITPLRRLSVDTASCGSIGVSGQSFSPLPTAHLDLYTVPQSFGEFYVQVVKGLMEDTYDRFNSILNFTLPGKYSVYLCPCPIYSVLWDSRFAAVVDPTRSAIYVLYTKQYNSADPFVVAHAAILRHQGYAPPVLSEGLANYLSFGIFDAKEMKLEKKLLPLDSILNTYAYYSSDPRRADRSSAAFVKYLLDQYKIDKFLALYKRADDLNLGDAISSTYGKPLATIEKEWLNYIDTLTFRAGQAAYFADRAEAMFDYQGMLQYNKEYFNLSRSVADSLYALEQLVRSNFVTGNYYDAEASQARLLTRDSSANNWISLASYQMMAGKFPDALVSLERARAKDSANPILQFNRAVHSFYTGDQQAARTLLSGLVAVNKGVGVESRVMLGNILMRSKIAVDRKAALGYFNDAIALANSRLKPGQPAPSDQMWSGIAYLGLGDTASANAYLQTAQFIETRPFYLGMISLWLGKCADIRGERKLARDYYGQVLAQASADYHQREAREYLEKAYTQ